MVHQRFRKLCRARSDWLGGIPSGAAVLANTGVAHASDRSFCLKFILIFIPAISFWSVRKTIVLQTRKVD